MRDLANDGHSSSDTDHATAELLQRIGRLIANDGQHRGLKPVQWEALRYLARANRFSRSPTALTSYLGSTKGTVSQTLKTLERNGWVEKRRPAEDKRAIFLELTQAGHSLLEDDPLGHIESALSKITPDRKEILRAALHETLHHALAATNGRFFGLCQSCRWFERQTDAETAQRCRLLKVALTDTDASKICIEQEP